MEIGRKNMLKNKGSCNDGKVALLKRYKAPDMESRKDASFLESRMARVRNNKCHSLERERINSAFSSPIKHFTTLKNLESTQIKRQKIRGFDKKLSEGFKQLKRAKDSRSRRWLYSSFVRDKLDATADSHLNAEGVKSKVDGRESLLDEVTEEETELELVLEGLGLIRKRGVDSRSNRVTHLVKGIWFGIEEEKSELKMANVELEKELARSRTDALKEVRQLKASHVVAIGQLQLETKANLDEMVEECD
ncbi:hypothetical protein GIB67_031097 [Kingdonia uniflora]|uniref:Uncharacterized protein n=1 Tax=Kingdonia uniflora TaxID=39325 RepID=A0A7J7NZU7_9MAGN|nr:hypothetical protein GIB67_031097 [Kingdonia uniflora]